MVASLVAGVDLEFVSFSAPFFPAHSHKFYMLGSSIPLHSGVRLVPPTSRKAGAMVALSPIPASEVTVELTCSHTGKILPEDDGALTIWFSPHYGRHVAVGNFYGVSPKIEGVLVIYDYRRGLFGYEKTGEVRQEEIGRDHHCPISSNSPFTLFLTFTSASLSLFYAHKGTKIHCFTMPLSSTSERFMGISAVSGYPCQRGVEVVALKTTLLLTPQRFVEQMAAANTQLDSLLTSIQAEYTAIGTRNTKLGELERKEVEVSILELQERVGRVVERMKQWQWQSLLEWEKSDEVTTYLQALETSLTALEAQMQLFVNVSFSFDVASIVQQQFSSQQEVTESDLYISALVDQMQREVRWYERLVTEESGMLKMYAGMGTVASIGAYLYWNYAKARKRHDV